MCNRGDEADAWTETWVRSIRRQDCIECTRQIVKGERHCATAFYDRNYGWERTRMHWGCRVLWSWLLGVVCGGEGTLILGSLRDELIAHDWDGEDMGLLEVYEWMVGEHRKLAEGTVANGK